jgi:hypothetical protein
MFLPFPVMNPLRGGARKPLGLLFIYLLLQPGGASAAPFGPGPISWARDTETIPQDTAVPSPPTEIRIAAFPDERTSDTHLSYVIDRDSQVRVQVFDLKGHLLETLEEGVRPEGEHRLRISSSVLPAGSGFIRVLTHTGERVVRLLLLE